MGRPKKIVNEEVVSEPKGMYTVRFLSSGKDFTASSRSIDKALDEVLLNKFLIKGFSILDFSNNLNKMQIRLSPARLKRLMINKVLKSIIIKQVKTVIG